LEMPRQQWVEILRQRAYDYIINCVGVLKPAVSEQNGASVQRAIRVNALFPHELAEIVKESRVIHMSTDGVFPGNQGRPYVETDPTDCPDAYGKTALSRNSMKGPIGAGFRFWRFRLQSAVLRPQRCWQRATWPLADPESSHAKWAALPPPKTALLPPGTSSFYEGSERSSPWGTSLEGCGPPQPGQLHIGSSGIPVPGVRPDAERTAGAGPRCGSGRPQTGPGCT
jgi:hypothetical protein